MMTALVSDEVERSSKNITMVLVFLRSFTAFMFSKLAVTAVLR